MVGHLSMYIQTETMSQSLIPTRGAACRREPLERARSNRRSHGGPAPAAGTLEYRKRKRTSVACRAYRGRSRGARRCFKRSSGFARHAAKKNVPRFLLEKIPKETGERSFLGGMVSEPEFRRRRTMRVAWLIQRVHENHAARTMGISDCDIVSV